MGRSGALHKTFVYYWKRAPNFLASRGVCAMNLVYHIEQPYVSVNGATAVATFYWTVLPASVSYKVNG